MTTPAQRGKIKAVKWGPSYLLVKTRKGPWYWRRVRVSYHDLTHDEKVYCCDEHLGGPFKTLAQAVRFANITKRKRKRHAR